MTIIQRRETREGCFRRKNKKNNGTDENANKTNADACLNTNNSKEGTCI